MSRETEAFRISSGQCQTSNDSRLTLQIDISRTTSLSAAGHLFRVTQEIL